MIAYNIPGIQEIILRLGFATVVGGTIGLNRDLHGKPAGLRTHALVTLGAALLALTSLQISTTLGGSVSDSLSRVIQGIVTGIGFLGAGVIIWNQAGHVHGLTTAATIWMAASLGVVCGVGYWLGCRRGGGSCVSHPHVWWTGGTKPGASDGAIQKRISDGFPEIASLRFKLAPRPSPVPDATCGLAGIL